jgi:predicted nucleotidyltransferase component of viral defense system
MEHLMNFHQAPEFRDALQSASSALHMRFILVEKDYWVTKVLQNLAFSEFRDLIVFKGGTSLSKAVNCIDRFSEDVDLAILKGEGMSDYRLNKLMKSIEENITTGLEYQRGHPAEEKRGRNRRTFYDYPKTNSLDVFGNVSNQIQLEINTFTNPVPFQIANIESYVATFLRQNGFVDFIDQYFLHPFDLQVLTRERTFFEKLLSVIRLSYNGPDTLKKKIRHFYDLYKLYNLPDLHSTLLSDESFKMVDMVIQDDKANAFFTGEWMSHPLSECPLFKDIDHFWGALKSTYESELSQISWAPAIPSAEQIQMALHEFHTFLQRYDNFLKNGVLFTANEAK